MSWKATEPPTRDAMPSGRVPMEPPPFPAELPPAPLPPEGDAVPQGDAGACAATDAGRADARATPTIVIDTREQTPLDFPAGVPTVRAGLRTGDYSIRGFEDCFTVERKSLADLVHTVIHERARFERELDRMRAFAFRRVLCTASMDAVRRGHYPHSRANPNAVTASIAAFEVRYAVPFVFAGTPAEAARRIVDWARYFMRECARRGHEGALARLAAGGSGGTGGTGGTPTLRFFQKPSKGNP